MCKITLKTVALRAKSPIEQERPMSQPGTFEAKMFLLYFSKMIVFV